MPESMRRRRWLPPMIFIVALLSAMTLQRLANSHTVTAQAPTLPQMNGIYLADPINPVLDLGRAQAYGVRVVSSVPDLIAGAPTAAAVILDRRYFDQMGPEWLEAQLAAGRVVVGLNVPSARLEQLRGFRQPSRPNAFVQDWGGLPFYSLVYQRRDASGALLVGAGSDKMPSMDGFFARLYNEVKDSPLLTPPPVR